MIVDVSRLLSPHPSPRPQHHSLKHFDINGYRDRGLIVIPKTPNMPLSCVAKCFGSCVGQRDPRPVEMQRSAVSTSCWDDSRIRDLRCYMCARCNTRCVFNVECRDWWSSDAVDYKIVSHWKTSQFLDNLITVAPTTPFLMDDKHFGRERSSSQSFDMLARVRVHWLGSLPLPCDPRDGLTILAGEVEWAWGAESSYSAGDDVPIQSTPTMRSPCSDARYPQWSSAVDVPPKHADVVSASLDHAIIVRPLVERHRCHSWKEIGQQ